MELRKDPITRSWVITGDDVPDNAPRAEAFCRFCPDSPVAAQLVSNMPGVGGGPWSARAVVHPAPLYRIEGEPMRRGDGIYDRMRSVGAHEVLVENARHDRQLWNASDAEIEQFLLLAAQRIQDLKRDARFKYVSIFKDHGVNAGQEFEHPDFAAHRDHFCAAPGALRTARRPGVLQGQGALRLLRHHYAGTAAERSGSSKCAATSSHFVRMRRACPTRPGSFPHSHDAAFERFATLPGRATASIWRPCCGVPCSGFAP